MYTNNLISARSWLFIDVQKFNFFWFTNMFWCYSYFWLIFIKNHKKLQLTIKNISYKKNKLINNLYFFNKKKYKLKRLKFQLFDSIYNKIKLSKFSFYYYKSTNIFFNSHYRFFLNPYYEIIGNKLLYNFWDLKSKKFTILKNITLRNIKQRFIKNSIAFPTQKAFKKMLTAQFFYIKNWKYNYDSLKFLFLIKTNTTEFRKITQHFKPYLFLNSFNSNERHYFFFQKILNFYLKFSLLTRRIRLNRLLFKKKSIIAKKNFSLNKRLFLKKLKYLKKNITSKKYNYFSYNLLSTKLIKTVFKLNSTSVKTLKYSFKTTIKRSFKRNILIFFYKKIELFLFFKQRLQFKFKRKLRKIFKKNKYLLKLHIFNVSVFKKKNFNINSQSNWSVRSLNVNNNMFNFLNIIKFKHFFFFKKTFNKKNLNYRNFFFKFKFQQLLSSRERTNFIFNTHSFLFLTSIFFSYFKHKIKKTLFNFLQKNDIQRYVLKHFLRNNLNSVFLKHNSVNSNGFRHKLIYKFFSRSFFKTLVLNTDTNSSLWSNLKYTNLSFLAKFSSKLRIKFSEKTNLNYSKYLNTNLSHQNTFSNLNIRRIKFKPGYMKIWREARAVLQTTMNLSYQYQYRLTKFIHKFKKFMSIKTYFWKELQVFKVLLKARLLPDNDSAQLFINNSLIFINGFPINNKQFQLFVGDYIQLVISLKYYIIYRWLLNWFIKKKMKLKYVSKKKFYIPKNFEEKQRSKNLTNKFLKISDIEHDIPKFIEVDYFSLSIIVLYEPFLSIEMTGSSFITTKWNILNLYNWKYIT